jgi:hypothetical protein
MSPDLPLGDHTCRQLLTQMGEFPIFRGNTPAMPLHDAHFGGFFISGGRK